LREEQRLRGFVWFDPRRTGPAVPTAWREYFARQTLPEVETESEETYHVLAAGLPDGVPPDLPRTLLEQMAWALLSPPLRRHRSSALRFDRRHPSGERQLPSSRRSRVDRVERIPGGVPARGGGGLTARVENADDAVRLTPALGLVVEVFRALLSEKTELTVEMIAKRLRPRARVLWWIARHLSARRKYQIRRQLGRVRSLFRVARPREVDTTAKEEALARRKSWDAPFPRPVVDVRVAHADGRIPVWIAMHWLELGGAEKFALDLVQALPKDRYVVYVTTDLPSENPWVSAIRDHVEEVVQLPTFLPSHMIGVFCEHYVRTRNLQLLHIHHAPRVYESLFHIRRFHPELKILDTLHILELPPHSGGYPEWTMRNFGVFIDHHHVTSEYLKNFLTQRWLVPEKQIDVVRTNVDTAWFDPARVPAGTLRRSHDIPEDALVVGFIGRFAPQKRPLEFVRLAAILSERWRRAGRDQALHFLMVGSGTLREQITEEIREAGLQDVVHLNGELFDTRPAYRDCDVIAMPSENEGLAFVTYEAMAMATPIFFTDVGAQSELLGPEQLVDAEMPVAPALADRMWPYLLDAQRRRALGERHRAHVLRHHPIEQSFRDMIRIYDALLGSDRRPSVRWPTSRARAARTALRPKRPTTGEPTVARRRAARCRLPLRGLPSRS
jgi:glycosyltransferase involved in cell wall biosynthesis